jgi:hypothetical protein
VRASPRTDCLRPRCAWSSCALAPVVCYEGAKLKNELKKRGYRWNDGSNGNPKSWFIDLEEERRSEEIEFLRKQIYCAEVTPNTREIDAYVRFSNRL